MTATPTVGGLISSQVLFGLPVGYVTVKVVFEHSADQLKDQLNRHAALYRPRSKPQDFTVEIFSGQHCAAISSHYLRCPTGFLDPIGHQLAALWMDVRYQDGDSWDLSCYTAFHHELTHRVNPWPFDPDFAYDESNGKGINHRIEKLCKLLPQFADTIRPYLLLWRYPDPNDNSRLIERKGKARETDHFEYGDALQYQDFLLCFGVTEEKPVHKITVRI